MGARERSRPGQSSYSRWSTSSLVCAPFLDTSFDSPERASMLGELRRRGYPRALIFVLRVLAGVGLWWNVFVGEWATLDLSDVLFGYSVNCGLLALVLGSMSTYRLVSGGSAGLLAQLAASAAVLATLWFFLARRGWIKTRELAPAADARRDDPAARRAVHVRTPQRRRREYALEVRPGAEHSGALAVHRVACLVTAMPGVARTGARAFEFERRDAGYAVLLDLLDVPEPRGAGWDGLPEHVSCIRLTIPEAYYEKSLELQHEMADYLAEKLGWSVYDADLQFAWPSTGEIAARLTGKSLPAEELARPHPALPTLDAAMRAEASFVEVFKEEARSQSLLSAAACYALACVLSIWLVFRLGLPAETTRSDWLLPLSVTLGGALLLTLKALVQAIPRFRRLRRTRPV